MTPWMERCFPVYNKAGRFPLHLEMAITGSPGWSENGGPWVKPADGMKKIVWTETRVKGGASNIVVP